MTIMTSYFRIRDDVVKYFLNFTRFLPIVYSYQVSASSGLNQKKFWKICLFDHVFSQALPHLLVAMATMNDLSPTYVNVLKVRKFGEDRLNFYEIFSKNPQGGGGHFALPVQIGLRSTHFSFETSHFIIVIITNK